MLFTKVHFLPPLEPQAVRRREAELCQAEARSHAAIISYPKSRKRRSRRPINSVSPSGDLEEENVAACKAKPTPYGERSLPSPIPKMLLSVETGGLDPFLKVADDLSRSDRGLLQTCKLPLHPKRATRMC